MSDTINIEQLGESIIRELKSHSYNVVEGMKKEARNSIQRLVKQTKKTAPVGKRKEHYRDSIKSKKMYETDNSISYVWYVDGSDYRLSHLLEHGHALRDGGRTEGTHFIQKAAEPILEEYMKAVEEVIKNG